MNKNTLRILLVGDYGKYQHSPVWARALSELGHIVLKFNTGKYFDGSLLSKVQLKYLRGPNITALNEALVKVANASKVDVLLLYKALCINPDTLIQLKGINKNLKIVSYNNDNIFGGLESKPYWRFYRQSIPLFDISLVYRESCVSNHKALGGRHCYLLRSHYIPWLHVKRANLIPEFDISFLGHCESDSRIEYMEHLMVNLCAKYNIRGSDWDKYGKNKPWSVMDTSFIKGDAYSFALCNTKIGLVFFSRLNQDDYTRRVFEIPACGTFMLAPGTDVMHSLYKDGTEAVFYDTPEDLLDKCRFFIKHDDLRDSIANAGYMRCISSGYDVVSRMREWIAYYFRIYGAK